MGGGVAFYTPLALTYSAMARYDNRRRMGVEVMVLSMLATPAMTRWEVPEKYHSTYFVIDMLVSCRHRFQKPNAAFFWSKQSEAILMCTFRQSANLTRLVLPLANDMMLKSIAVHCRLEKYPMDESNTGIWNFFMA